MKSWPRKKRWDFYSFGNYYKCLRMNCKPNMTSLNWCESWERLWWILSFCYYHKEHAKNHQDPFHKIIFLWMKFGWWFACHACVTILSTTFTCTMYVWSSQTNADPVWREWTSLGQYAVQKKNTSFSSDTSFQDLQYHCQLNTLPLS